MSKHPEPVTAEGTEARHDTRDRILDAGAELILGRGFSAVGLAEILGRAQVPKGSFYYYFDSKETSASHCWSGIFRITRPASSACSTTRA